MNTHTTPPGNHKELSKQKKESLKQIPHRSESLSKCEPELAELRVRRHREELAAGGEQAQSPRAAEPLPALHSGTLGELPAQPRALPWRGPDPLHSKFCALFYK